MKSKIRINIKYFPFSPGIAWKVKNGKYIIPKLDQISWNRALENREVVLVCHGGLFESFFSLSILEALNSIRPDKKLYWCGDSRFDLIYSLNNLAKKSLINIDEETLENYPTPLFLDKNKYVYFNCLSNYINISTYYGRYAYDDQKAVVKQIFRNSLLEWDKKYIPKLRKKESIEFDKWVKLTKFKINQPYALILPERTGWSDHSNSCLSWNVSQVKSVVSILKQSNIQPVIISPYASRYYDVTTFTLLNKLEFLFNLIPSAKIVLSEDVDILLLAMMISNSKIISQKQKREFALGKNKKFLNVDNEIVEKNNLLPIDVYMELKKGSDNDGIVRVT